MIDEIGHFSWTIVFVLTAIGTALLKIGFKGFQSDSADEKDSFGVAWSERFGMLALNGVFVLLAALLITVIKLVSGTK